MSTAHLLEHGANNARVMGLMEYLLVALDKNICQKHTKSFHIGRQQIKLNDNSHTQASNLTFNQPPPPLPASKL